MIADSYLCPEDRQPLADHGGEFLCIRCNRRYGKREGILDLDIIKSSQSKAFDKAFKSIRELTESEKNASSSLAENFLTHVGDNLKGKRLVDIGCGNGALAYGLLTSRSVVDCDIFCFDHSSESMRVFLNTVANIQTTNRLEPSLQDVHRLAYPDNFFDVVFGSAILHHLLEYETVLAQIYRSLKKGGVAIFAEPFAYGYMWTIFLLKLAGANTSGKPLGMGGFDFITKDIFFRLNNFDNKDRLAKLIDKHLFIDDELVNLCTEIGFSVKFAPFAPKEYYKNFMSDIIKTYDISNQEVTAKAAVLYESLKKSIPESLHRMVPHFKFIILRKPL